MSGRSDERPKLRLARVPAVTKKGEEILVPSFPLLRYDTKKPQGARVVFISQKTEEHSLMTIAFDLLKRGVELDEIKRRLPVPSKWTEQQIRDYISVNGKMTFCEK